MVTKKKAVKKLQPYEIGELDHYLFGQGNHYEIYKKLGAHEVTAGKKGVYFAVWAPHAKSVSVIGEFNGWDAAADRMDLPIMQSFGRELLPGLRTFLI